MLASAIQRQCTRFPKSSAGPASNNRQDIPVCEQLHRSAVSLAVFELMEIHGGQDMEHAVEPFVKALWNGLDPKRQTGKANTPHRKGTGKP